MQIVVAFRLFIDCLSSSHKNIRFHLWVSVGLGRTQPTCDNGRDLIISEIFLITSPHER